MFQLFKLHIETPKGLMAPMVSTRLPFGPNGRTPDA
jgi:hypothetical protein